MSVLLFVIFLCAALNRARGDDRWMPARLPGRALWYVAPLVGVAALLVVSWPIAVATAAAYLFWGLWPWGRWYDLGRLPAPIAASNDNFETLIERLAGGNNHRALFLRHLMVAPGLVLLGWLAGWPAALIVIAPFLAAAAITLTYELAWRLNPSNPIWLAELATGAIWAGVILACSVSSSSSPSAFRSRPAPLAVTATTSWTAAASLPAFATPSTSRTAEERS